MTEQQLLLPFADVLFKNIPDLNTKRATNSNPKKRQWIYPEPPVKQDTNYPIISINFTELKPGVIYDYDIDKYIFHEGTLKISFWIKKGISFLCDDNIRRENQALLEYIKTKYILKVLTSNRNDIKRYSTIDTYLISSGFQDEYTSQDWLLGTSIDLKVFGKIYYQMPIDLNAIIGEIELNITSDDDEYTITGD